MSCRASKHAVVTAWAMVAIVAFCAASKASPVPIDGRTASRWQAQPAWSPGHAAEKYGVEDDGGWLAFSVAGRDKVMTWTFQPSPEELLGEPRYLVFRYRASDLNTSQGNYLLLADDGSPGNRSLLGRHHLIADGQEHVHVVDLLSYAPPKPIERFALRIGPASDGKGRLLVQISFADEPPAGAEPIRESRRAPQKVRIEMEKVDWQPSPQWTPRPPLSHQWNATEHAARFQMTGQQRSMRWSAKAPEGLDLEKMPFVAVRYRAKGDFGPFGYVFYLGVRDAGGKQVSSYAMEPGNVEPDGRWHVFHKKLAQRGCGSSMAVGIDALSPQAEIEIDYVEYTSAPPQTPIDEVVQFQTRQGKWRPGDEGLTTVALPPRTVPPNHFMLPRMGIGSWFTEPQITVEGVPFEIPTDPAAILASSTVGEEKVEVPLPPGCQEVLFLLAAAFPSSERFGSSWDTPAPLRMLSEPERLTVELVYADGTSDHMLPVHAAKAEYGVGHGVALYSVRPSPGLSPTKFVLHDNMRSAAFGILGVTVNTGRPRVPEPEVQKIWYPPVRKPPLSEATVRFDTHGGLTWNGIESAMLGGRIDLAGEPVFSLSIGNQEILSSQWKIEKSEKVDGGLKVMAVYTEGGMDLRAVFQAKPVERNTTLLTLELSNGGGKPVTGTLQFPRVSGLKIGSVDETWYFCGRRGGVINRVPCFWRDEIGEPHPLQVDGFFHPSLGAGISFMPRDLDGVFRWYRVSKDERGGGYALEFLPQTVAPGGTWESVPTAVAVIPGDWKDQFNAYLAWAKTWYRPIAPRKPWFAKVFAFPTYCPATPADVPVDKRLDLVAQAQRIREAIGACDYMHLFGWAITEEYGHWGDYDRYHQLGGKERFIESVRACQHQEIPVGLYLDGYLVSTKSQKPSQAEREKWAVRREDGKMLYHENYVAHSMCPYVPGWQDYLTAAYRRVAEEIRPSGMYIDEFGKCMVHRTCYAEDHGHRRPMGMCPGEWILTRQVREAIPPEIATYCEYEPADVACQYLDGAFGHVPLHGHRDGYDQVAPHYINLQRFAFPDFKMFQLIYYVPLEHGNWFLLKYPFFDGDGYYLTGGYIDADDHARAFQKRVYRLQHAHADAFTSTDVEPLVATEAANLFANRFSAPGKTVWTLFNANYRTLRGKLLCVPHVDGAKFIDAWNDRPIAANVVDGRAELTFEIGPRSVGCIVKE